MDLEIDEEEKDKIFTCKNTRVSDEISSNTDIESMVCSHLNEM